MLVDPILEFEKQNPQAPCLYRLQGDQWISYSRAEVVDAVYRLCTQWQSDELKPGQRLLVLMENRPEWAVAAIACNLYGLVLVPAYTTHQEHEIDYLLDKSQASAVTSDGELSDRLKSVERRESAFMVRGGQSIRDFVLQTYAAKRSNIH